MKKTQKRIKRKYCPSVRRRFLASDMFLLGERFTISDLQKQMPKTNDVDLKNMTSILKIEGILTTISSSGSGRATIFYKTKPAFKPWLHRSWRSVSNESLGIKKTPFR